MYCRIRVQGHVAPAWGRRLGGFEIAHEEGGTSVLSGPLPDQAALHGVLLPLGRMGLPLLSLDTSEAERRAMEGGEGGVGRPVETQTGRAETAMRADTEVSEMQARATEAGEVAMTGENSTVSAQAYEQPRKPSPNLRSLDRLVGTWEVSGGAQGTTTYEWMEGGFFLLQHVSFDQGGQKVTGLEVIGHERTFMAEPSENIKSRFYSNTGDTLDYTYELEGDTLTIWAGDKGSPAYYRGTFSDDGDTLTGAWHYPGGGGYEATSTRVECASTPGAPGVAEVQPSEGPRPRRPRRER